MTPKQIFPSRTKTLIIFILTIIIGFILFALPNLFFGISKINGGLTGINLLLIALFQVLTVSLLIHFSLKLLKKDFSYVGVSSKNWKKDSILGLITGLAWVALQFGWIIPNTGGVERPDVLEVVNGLDGSVAGIFYFIALGVLGGGIAEELYNRGYFINVLKSTFRNPDIGLWISSLLSILFFVAGHLPSNSIEWIDILVSTIAFTVLFLVTKRLTASIVAHSTWNTTAILLINYLY